MTTRILRFAGLLAVLAAACGGEPPATADEARAFLDDAEARLLDAWISTGRAGWIQSTHITEDTTAQAAAAQAEVIGLTMALAAEAARFDAVELPDDLRRKLLRLKTSLGVAAPADPARQAELAAITTGMEAAYGRGEYCPEGDEACLSLPELERRLAEVRDTDELLDLWLGWRTVAPPMRDDYVRFVELANAGARDLGFADLGELWRAGYDMPPDAFTGELERLWGQVSPLYESLHCHVRGSLADEYGSAIVPPDGPIPAHLLGNMWSQTWANVFDLVAPRRTDPGYDLTDLLEDADVDEIEMVRYGERFFSSLGFEPLPDTFWERSLFVQPPDRDVVCHASAWNVDHDSDVRIKMCLDVDGEDFVTVHHELGHNYYQRAYRHRSPLDRDGAHDGFHEGIGDTIALSMTPEYLVEVGLLDRAPPADRDIGLLLRLALDKVAFLPFGLLVDQWRWQVFSCRKGSSATTRRSSPRPTTRAGGRSGPPTRASAPRPRAARPTSTPAPSTTSPPTCRTRATSSRTSCSSSFTGPCARRPATRGPCTAARSTAAGRRGSGCGRCWRRARAGPGATSSSWARASARWTPPPSSTTSRPCRRGSTSRTPAGPAAGDRDRIRAGPGVSARAGAGTGHGRPTRSPYGETVWIERSPTKRFAVSSTTTASSVSGFFAKTTTRRPRPSANGCCD